MYLLVNLLIKPSMLHNSYGLAYPKNLLTPS